MIVGVAALRARDGLTIPTAAHCQREARENRSTHTALPMNPPSFAPRCSGMRVRRGWLAGQDFVTVLILQTPTASHHCAVLCSPFVVAVVSPHSDQSVTE